MVLGGRRGWVEGGEKKGGREGWMEGENIGDKEERKEGRKRDRIEKKKKDFKTELWNEK